MNKCIICGTDFVDGKCPHAHVVEPMCLNCKYVNLGEENSTCFNENVLKKAYDKMMEALPEGFEVENLTIKPMLLKNPCKKCPNHTFDTDRLVAAVLSSAGVQTE